MEKLKPFHQDGRVVPYCICFLPKNIGVCVSELKNAKDLVLVHLFKVKILPKAKQRGYEEKDFLADHYQINACYRRVILFG